MLPAHRFQSFRVVVPMLLGGLIVILPRVQSSVSPFALQECAVDREVVAHFAIRGPAMNPEQTGTSFVTQRNSSPHLFQFFDVLCVKS
jgi:hypothetical protein